jgi:hypothetical protein
MFGPMTLNETICVQTPKIPVKQFPLIPVAKKTGDGEYAIHHQFVLEALVQQLPHRNERARGWAMIETSAILGLFSLAMFAAHAVDAYRTRAGD